MLHRFTRRQSENAQDESSKAYATGRLNKMGIPFAQLISGEENRRGFSQFCDVA
jgi:hypothetical protein